MSKPTTVLHPGDRVGAILKFAGEQFGDWTLDHYFIANRPVLEARMRARVLDAYRQREEHVHEGP